MCRFETELQSFLPKTWFRFVDDVFAIIKISEIGGLLKMLNGTKYKSIKFTYEVEKDGKLPFPDLLLTRRTDGSIDIGVYRKPTSTDRCITNESHCPSTHKMAALHSMINRLCKLPLSINSFMNELKRIKEIALTNGYTLSTVESLVKI